MLGPLVSGIKNRRTLDTLPSFPCTRDHGEKYYGTQVAGA